MKSPVFLFSLPRSGSTLLQRMLLSHSQIGGTAEPWILLPLIYAIKRYGTYAEYSHTSCFNAIQDFISTLPNREMSYLSQLSKCAFSLYQEQLYNGELYFLDKTPRYYLIIPEIAKMFPRAKFIFLFRNPLSILSSVIKTWNNDKLRLHNNYIDLINGPRKIAEGYEILKKKAVRIQYEDLVENPEDQLKRIVSYLDINFESHMVEKFMNLELSGRMGDPTGRFAYDKVEKNSIDKWKKTLYTKRRVSYAKKYLKKIGSSVLDVHGYTEQDLISQLSSLTPKQSGYITDNYNLLIGSMFRTFEFNQVKTRIKRKIDFKDKPFYQHM